MILILFFPLLVFSQLEKPKWDYPVKPGSEEWKKFKSVDDMYQKCQIPDDFKKQLDTENLVDICLNFPAPPQFLFYNTPQDGFMSYYSNFNGIRELFNRKDAGRYLLKKYAEMSLSDFNPQWPLYKQGQFISHYKFVEAILAQTHIIRSLNSEERKSLMKEVIRKMDEKLTKSELFSGNNIEINFWVMAKLLSYENKLSIPNRNLEDIQTFLDSGLFVDVDINSIFKQAKMYAYENIND
jgi:hypothetical protein